MRRLIRARLAGASLVAALAAAVALGAAPTAASVPAPPSLPAGVEPLPVADVLALTPEMRDWAHRQVPQTLPPIARLDLLVRRLQAADGAALRYDSWFTATAADAFAARRFNCLSFSHLLVAMARELGLDAYYLEARYRQRYDREGDLVLLAGHITVGWGEGPHRWMVEFGNQAKLETARVRQLDDRRALALHYTNLGAAALRKGDAREALRALATAVDVDPGTAGAWVNLGVALRRHGDYAGAEAAYRRAIAADGELVPGFANLYSLLRASRRGKEADALVVEITRLHNRDPWLLLALGDACFDAGDLAGAERLFRRARAEAPKEAAPAAALAGLAMARGDLRKARKWALRAEKLDDQEPRLAALRAPLGLPQPPLRTSSNEATTAPASPAPTPLPSPERN